MAHEAVPRIDATLLVECRPNEMDVLDAYTAAARGGGTLAGFILASAADFAQAVARRLPGRCCGMHSLRRLRCTVRGYVIIS